MSETTYKIVYGKLSDGYHTLDELYDHRRLLFLAWVLSDGNPGHAYWVAQHYPGWDLVVTHVRGQQISYHVPICYRDIVRGLPEKTVSEHVWDGHTAADVAKIIREYLRSR